MAHIMPSQMGGNPSRNMIENVWMLCKPMHDVFDARVSWKQASPHIAALYKAYADAVPLRVPCIWPKCDMRAERELPHSVPCDRHLDVLTSAVVPGRAHEIRLLAQAFIAQRYSYGD